MKRLFTLIMVAIAMAILAAPVAAHGHGDGPMNKKKCEEAGGVWSNERGEKSCFKIVATEDRPDDVGTDPDPIRDLFWAEVDRLVETGEIDRETDTIVFWGTHQQRGNIGARGTSSSYNLFYDSLCAALGSPEFVHPAACAMLYALVFPDD